MPQKPLQFDGRVSFSGGINTRVHPSIVPDDQAVELLNVDLTEPGLSQRRKGMSVAGNNFDSNKVITIKGYSKTSVDKRLLAIANSTLFEWTGTGTWTSVGSIGTSVTDAKIVIAGDSGTTKAYIFTDTGNVRSYDGSTIVDLGNGNDDPPTSTTVALYHKNRMLVAKGDELFWADVLTPGAGEWNLTVRVLRLDQGLGQFAKGMIELNRDQILVFFDRSVFLINTAPTVTRWVATKISDRGCVSGRSIVRYGNAVYYMARDGYWRVGSPLSLTEFLENGLLSRIDWQSSDKIEAQVWDNRIFLSIPVDGADENNRVLVYHIFNDAQGIGKGWTEWESSKLLLSSFAEYDFDDNRKLYGARNDTGTVYEMETGFLDDGTPYEFREVTGMFVHGAEFMEKSPVVFEVNAISQDNLDVPINVYASADEENFVQVFRDDTQDVWNIARGVLDLDDFPYDDFEFEDQAILRGKFFTGDLLRFHGVQYKIVNFSSESSVQIRSRISSADFPEQYRTDNT